MLITLYHCDFQQSLDYDICENVLWEKEEITKKPRFKIRKDFDRWIISFYIGVLTAFVGCFIAISIEEISSFKYSALQESMKVWHLSHFTIIHGSFLISVVKKNSMNGNLVWPYLAYVLMNVVPVIFGSFLVTVSFDFIN